MLGLISPLEFLSFSFQIFTAPLVGACPCPSPRGLAAPLCGSRGPRGRPVPVLQREPRKGPHHAQGGGPGREARGGAQGLLTPPPPTKYRQSLGPPPVGVDVDAGAAVADLREHPRDQRESGGQPPRRTFGEGMGEGGGDQPVRGGSSPLGMGGEGGLGGSHPAGPPMRHGSPPLAADTVNEGATSLWVWACFSLSLSGAKFKFQNVNERFWCLRRNNKKICKKKHLKSELSHKDISARGGFELL